VSFFSRASASGCRPFQLVLIDLTFGARDPADLQQTELDASAAVAQLASAGVPRRPRRRLLGWRCAISLRLSPRYNPFEFCAGK